MNRIFTPLFGAKNNTSFVWFCVFACMLSLFFSISISTSAYAYTCAFSGPNGNGKDKYGRQLEYNGNGSCIVKARGDKNNDEREIIRNPDGGTSYKCPTSMFQVGDDCYDKVDDYTSERPTQENGEQIDNKVWDQTCTQGPDYWGVGSHYNSHYHACEVDSMCANVGLGPDTGGVGLPGGDVNVNDSYFSGVPGCRSPGDGGFEMYDEPDPSQQIKDDCINGGGIYDGSKPDGQECSHTAESCTAKGLAFDRAAGKCVEPPGYCDKYTDQAQKEACEKGQAGEDCNQFTDPAQKAACEDGDTNNPNTAGGPTTEEIPQVETRCGEARVNILICGEEGGNTALNNILRIVVMVLTVGVGVAAVGGLAWASVLYAKAEDNEGNVSSAKELIRNIVIGLLLYVFLVAITNWLVPGGVIG